jgi:hypothetical protein
MTTASLPMRLIRNRWARFGFVLFVLNETALAFVGLIAITWNPLA